MYIMYTWYIHLGGHVLEDYEDEEEVFKVAAVSGSAVYSHAYPGPCVHRVYDV